MAVIGMREHDDVFPARMRARQPQSTSRVESSLLGGNAIPRISEKEIGAGRGAVQTRAWRRISAAGKARPQPKKIENNLKMTVWPPPAVFIRRAQLRKFFATPD